MSKSLLKLLDKSLFPASLLIIGKFLGVILTIKIFSISTTIKEYSNSIFFLSSSVKTDDIAVVTSYSDLFMYAVIAVFLSVSIFRSLFLSSNKISQPLVLKLLNRNLLSLIKDSYELYHETVVWVIFSIVANVLIWVNAIMGGTYLWIAIATSFSTIVLITIILQDVYREIENIKQHPGQYKWH